MSCRRSRMPSWAPCWGRILERPHAAFLTGVASHTILDYLPHNDSQDPIVLLGTGCGVCAILAGAFLTGDEGMIAGALGGILPDAEHVLRGHPRPGAPLFPGHHFRHEGRYGARLGRGVEASLVAVSLLAVFLAGAMSGSRPRRGGVRAGA